MEKIRFLDEQGTFSLAQPENYSNLYFPAANELGLKGALTPNFGGDCKLDQNTFLLEPVSVENLHNNRGVRNFWVGTENDLWSAVGASAAQEAQRFTPAQEDSTLSAGFMWQRVRRSSAALGLTAEVLCFVPPERRLEVFSVTLENTGSAPLRIFPTAAIPIYGRSADNLRDHRHVTSLLHRIETTEHGVLVKPTLSFDERGHRKNDVTYFVCGIEGDGACPVGYYPTVEDFIGQGGTLTHPRALLQGQPPVPAGRRLAGKEALGGIAFAERTLAPGERVRYTVLLGATTEPEEIRQSLEAFATEKQVLAALRATQQFWDARVNVRYCTGDGRFDQYLRWISFQPFLRRIYGCSFLPHHDYGRGGRGWRDLWQDCLSLLLMEPDGVRRMIVQNFAGVRIDGTNATIIGTGPGEFIADRNGICRVWMDHGVWPFLTTKLYIDQTGDLAVLLESVPYFKDGQNLRGMGQDTAWTQDVLQKTASGAVYSGTILEHILLETLCAVHETGAHGHIRLRGADWNDALDMAAEYGESVAFTCAYAGNLEELAGLLRVLAERGHREVELLEELELLLEKENRLPDFLHLCAHSVRGSKRRFDTLALADTLQAMAERLRTHIRKTEWIAGENEGWFNSYYDNHQNRVEGYFPGGVRMMLTGQVFAVMSGTATPAQTSLICRAADRYLYRKEVGGYRLNTDFHEEKFDLGRMFGFAYGEKENGAVFSHMTVMYANALYRRGFVREGYKALQSLAETAMDFETSRIYPGIPEYFNADGRGLYHYLTGAASWYILTFITQVFGVRGELGGLVIEPKLVREQFDGEGTAQISLHFAGKAYEITLQNPQRLDYGAYKIVSASCNDEPMQTDGVRVRVPAQDAAENRILLTLGERL